MILTLSDGKSIKGSLEKVEGLHQFQLQNGEKRVYFRQGQEIRSYKYSSSTSSWDLVWCNSVYPQDGDFHIDRYPWLVARGYLDNNSNIIVLRHPEGIRFYKDDFVTQGLELINEDTHFLDDIPNILIGRFFPNSDWIGLMSRNGEGKVEFFAATEESFDPEEIDPLFPLKTKQSLSTSWSHPETIFFSEILEKHSTKEIIGLRSQTGLELYEFNSDYLLEPIKSTTEIVIPKNSNWRKDFVYFTDMTNNVYRDILHLNDSGLFLYEYSNDNEKYRFLSHYKGLSKYNGFLQFHRDSVRLADINNDGYDDVIYNGPQGLTIMKFDYNSKNWKTLFEPNRLIKTERYITVVGTLPPHVPQLLQTSIITQDFNGHITWSYVKEVPDVSLPKDLPTEIPPTYEKGDEEEYYKFLPNENQRKLLSEKPDLRWSDQWDDKFLKDPVDMSNGHVNFQIPLIDITDTTGWEVALALSYNSDSTNTDMLGYGWSLPLGQDYIVVDYRNSIYDEDAQFYLVVKGERSLLKLIKIDGDFKYFCLANAGDDKIDFTIKYNTKEQFWVLDSDVFEVTYGRANRNGTKDAVQWGLSWSNWRGQGRNKSQLKPIIIAWYLNMRFDKQKQSGLYYSYDIYDKHIENGKKYTSSILLKSIEGNETQLEFHYEHKKNSEYTEHNPINKSGDILIPTSLENSYFLMKCRVSTPSYVQTFKFKFETIAEKRFLTSIDQELSSQSEHLLRFSYVTFLGKTVLETCASLIRGSVISFTYGSVIVPPKFQEKIHPTRQVPKIAYGSDYILFTYKNMNPTKDTLIFHIMNSDMSLKIVDCLDQRICLSMDHKITDYLINAWENSFGILLKSESKQILYIYNRQNEKWVRNINTFTFSEKALALFSDTIIAISDPNEAVLRLIKLNDEETNWEQKEMKVPRPIKLMAVFNKAVICYDDSELSTYYAKDRSTWKRQVLDSQLPEVVAGNKNIINRFELSDKHKEVILKTLDQYGLHVYYNYVLLSSLKESDGKLFSVIHVFILNSLHNVIKTQEFTIERTNLKEISVENISENGEVTFHLGYIEENGLYKVRIKKLSGDKVESMREHEINEAIRDSNEELKKQELNLVNWTSFVVQICQNGFCVGNDTILRFTGTELEKDILSTKPNIELGKNFLLQDVHSNQTFFKLFKRDQKHPIKEFYLESPGRILNRFPLYIAHESQSHEVELLTFTGNQTLGDSHNFPNEMLLPESSYHTLLTIANVSTSEKRHVEPMEVRVRPLSSLVSLDPQIFVRHTLLSNNELNREMSYEYAYDKDEQSMTYTLTITKIPGGKKSLSGWYERTLVNQLNTGNVTQTDKWFNFEGQEVFNPTEKKRNDSFEFNDSKATRLLDSSKYLIVSDFSPFEITEEMGSYYGFESYEMNVIGAMEKNNVAKTWQTNNADIIRGSFSFTGESYLKLESKANNLAFIQGEFEPLYQESSKKFVAACWLRCRSSLNLDSPAAYFKATLRTTNGTKVITLQSQVKKLLEDWSYHEVVIDFGIVKQIYLEYFKSINNKQTNNSNMPLPSNVRFKIILRVEAPLNEIVDVDHIRFSLINHDFQANVFHPVTGMITAIIQANGLPIRKIYNHLQSEIGNIKEDGTLEVFTSTSLSGKLAENDQKPLPGSKPCKLIFEPDYGYFENYDSYSLRKRWKILNLDAWKTGPGQLWHDDPNTHRIEAKSNLLDKNSVAIRMYFAMNDLNSSILLIWRSVHSLILSRKSGNTAILNFSGEKSVHSIPTAGELIIMIEQSCVFVWLNGVLLIDSEIAMNTVSLKTLPIFALEVRGKVLIQDTLIMNRPQLKIEYSNAFDEKDQTINFEDSNTIIVTETLYDEFGRGAITTKSTRIHRKPNQSLLAYHPEFVSNKNPEDADSVWKTGRIRGESDRLNPDDEGVPYTRLKYAPTPLNEESVIGLPGKDFSIEGKYATKMSRNSDSSFLNNMFPAEDGYYQKVVHTPNGNLNIAVFDKRNNKIAVYIKVQSFNHLLSTYEYDDKDRLIKMLPPLYHENVNTSLKLTPWKPGEHHLSKEEKQWQHVLSTRFVYDENNLLISKTTPDSGTTEFFYDSNRNMRFMVRDIVNNKTSNVVYLDYNSSGDLVRTGYVTKPISISSLAYLVEAHYLPHTQDYQLFNYDVSNLNPTLRGRVKHLVTTQEDATVLDILNFDDQEQIVEKNSVIVFEKNDIDNFSRIRKDYNGDKLRMLRYPFKIDGSELTLVHTYNRLGQLVALGTNGNPNKYATFSYYSTGKLAYECILPNTPFSITRSYQYNSPGFLKSISDSFLTQNLSYTENGYGQNGYGDGMIMGTVYTANWSMLADKRQFQIRESDIEDNHSKLCLKALKRGGYLSKNGQPLKLFIRKSDIDLPLVCSANNIAILLAKKYFPFSYGHRYLYGPHQDLAKAKYFTEESKQFSDPLQPHSFSKHISLLSKEQSNHVWNLLENAGYLTSNQQDKDKSSAIGKHGKPLIRRTDLFNDLKALKDYYVLYAEKIERLIILTIINRKTLTLIDFEEYFLKWEGLHKASPIPEYERQKQISHKIWQMLSDKHYLSGEYLSGSLPKELKELLKDYTILIPDIIKVIWQSTIHEIGETPFDEESYEIDANGNHQTFYSGFNRYNLKYQVGTNKIQSVQIGSSPELLSMEHDSEGNVIKALHKSIEHIEYLPVSKRTKYIKLTDGRTLKFYYDSQGERILKRVYSANGTKYEETQYLRDEKGRVLLDRRTKFTGSSPSNIITAYIYGPRGLIGFLRNKNIYAVTTDHAASVRLVIKNDEVVAAYDYLPYGEVIRSYVSDPIADIAYRYTGQEWDEETRLYNYHARFYDPSIGRFYQPDPKSQYFSPYKYAGNSPISVIDPDGEFAFLLAAVIVCAVAGMYLGGAAANKDFNPFKWKWKRADTWIAIGLGGLVGALLPLGAVSSAAFISAGAGTFVSAGTAQAIGIGVTALMGLSVGYLSAAAAMKDFNVSNWKWDSPELYNAFFHGFAMGSGLFSGIGHLHRFANTSKFLTSVSKLLHVNRNIIKSATLLGAYSTGGGLAYYKAVSVNNGTLDLSKPGTYFEIIDGLDLGLSVSQGLLEIAGSVKKLRNILKSKWNREKLKKILKNPNHPMYKLSTSIIMGYIMGSAATGQFDFTKWNLNEFSTYEGILNGVVGGKDFTQMLKSRRSPKSEGSFKNNYGGNDVKSIMLEKLEHTQEIRKNIEYKRLMEESFTDGSNWLSKLKNEPISVKHDIEQFFKLGLESWKKGASDPPKALKKAVMEKANQNIDGLKTRDNEIKKEMTEELNDEHMVYPEDDVDFLSCSSGMKRFRRQPPLKKCKLDLYSDKPEVIEHFFAIDNIPDKYTNIKPKYTGVDYKDGEFNPKFCNGFAQHLSMVLSRTPNVLSTTKPDFFPNFILGSLLTKPFVKLPQDMKYFFTNVDYMTTDYKINKEFVKTKIVHIYYKISDSLMGMKTFFAVDHRITSGLNEKARERIHENLKNNVKMYDINESYVAKEFKMNNNYKVNNDIFFIDSKNELYVINKSYSDRKNLSPTTQGNDFTKVEIEDSRFFKDINFGDSSDIKKVTKEILEFYSKNKDAFKFNEDIEAGFHGFLYGALTLNLKKYFNLDVYVERIAGKGFADLLVLPRKTGSSNKDWQATPIIFELKSSKTDSGDAKVQITETGYHYNLSLRTVAKTAIIVGCNSKTGDISLDSIEIPQPNGFINKVMETESILKEELNHLYYSFSPLVIKKGSNPENYLSKMILGQIISENPGKIYIRNKDRITTIAYEHALTKKWILINIHGIHKNVKKITDKANIPAGADIKKIDISFNGDKTKPSMSQTLTNTLTPAEMNDFQLIDIERNRLDIDNFFKDTSDVGNEMSKLEESITKFKDIINSESDFQAIIQGLFNGRVTEDYVIKVFSEANLSKDGRSDILITKLQFEGNTVREVGVILMELKYAQTGDKLQEAIDQIFKYKSNLKSITDLAEVTLIPASFNKNSANVVSFKVYPPEGIDHSSVSSSTSSDSQSSIRRKKRTIYCSKTENSTNKCQNHLVFWTKPQYLKQMPNNKGENYEINTSNFNLEFATSSANRHQSWPINLIKKAGKKVLSFLPSGFYWKNNFPLKPETHLKSLVISTSSQNIPLGNGQRPSVLEIGDRWLKESEITGGLTWAIFWVRKWTGYKPSFLMTQKEDLGDTVILDVHTVEILNEFVDDILKISYEFGIGETMNQLIDNVNMYSECVKVIRKKLATGHSDSVTQYLYRQIVQNHEKEISLVMNEKTFEELISEFNNVVSSLQKNIDKQEFDSFSSKKCDFSLNPEPFQNYHNIRSHDVISNLYDPYLNENSVIKGYIS